MEAAPNYLTTKKVLQRYDGISAMTLWRWERDPALPFPRPLVINRRKFYELPKIEAWERARAAAATATFKAAAEAAEKAAAEAA